MRVFVDTHIPMYPAGRDHAFKAPSADFMRAAAWRRIEGVSDVEVLQEILHRYAAVRRLRVGRLAARRSGVEGPAWRTACW